MNASNARPISKGAHFGAQYYSRTWNPEVLILNTVTVIDNHSAAVVNVRSNDGYCFRVHVGLLYPIIAYTGKRVIDGVFFGDDE